MTGEPNVESPTTGEQRGLQARLAAARREADQRTAGWGSGSDAADDVKLVGQVVIGLWAFCRELWRARRRGPTHEA